MSTDANTPEASFSTWELLESSEPSAGAIGTGELLRLLLDPDFQLTHAQSARLFRSPPLRARLKALKASLAGTGRPIDVPEQAAASSGQLERRRLEHALLEIVPVRRSPDFYVHITFDAGHAPPGRSSLVMEDREGRISKIGLREPDPIRRDCQVRLDPADPDGAALLAALRDASAAGSIIPEAR